MVSTQSQNRVTAEILASGLSARLNIDTVKLALPHRQEEAARQAELGDQFRDMSLVDLCREAVLLDGHTVPRNHEDVVRAAVSGSSLTNIFTTTANAALLSAYSEAPDSTAGWVREVAFADFKMHERIRLEKTAGLTKHVRGGEADHAAPSDVMESYRVARYSQQFAVDEMDIIDDNVNALSTMPTEMGLAAARLRPDLVYSILLANAALADGVNLFHSDHSNTGIAVLGSAGLKVAVAAMRAQRENDVPLNIRPRFLIVPGDLEFTAAELIKSATIVVAGSTDTERGSRNVIADLSLQVRADDRLSAAGVTCPNTGTEHTGSATNWFLAGDPLTSPSVEVAYLLSTGNAPVLRSYQLRGGQFGIGFDIKLDIAAAAVGAKSLYRSTGGG